MKTRITSAAVATLLLVVAFAAPASAESGSQQQREQGATTTFWSVSPATRSGTAQNGPLELTWVVSRNTAYSYFDAVNTGGAQVSATTVSAVSVDGPNNSGNNAGNNPNNNSSNNPNNNRNPSEVAFEWCDDGLWDLANDTCDGTIVALGSNTGPDTLVAVITRDLAVGERLSLRAITPQNRTEDLTTNISFSVSRSSIRPPVTTNSTP